MSVELALQKAIIMRLRADEALKGVTGPIDPPATGARVYDNPTAKTAYPYVSLRSIQAVDDGADGIDGQEVYIDFDAWSSEPGKTQASRMASAVRKSLNFAPLILDEPYALLEIAHRSTQVDAPSDGLTTRARLSFRALVESV